MEGGGKHLPPPVLHQPKKPGMNRVKLKFGENIDLYIQYSPVDSLLISSLSVTTSLKLCINFPTVRRGNFNLIRI